MAPAAALPTGSVSRPGLDRIDPVLVLRDWDAARASAYAKADAGALRRLYVSGSTAARADAALLRSYAARGLEVWLRAQVFSVQVLTATEADLALRVTDRTVTVIGDGVRCRGLPASVPTTRLLRLTRVRGRWLMRSVSPAPPPAPR